MRIRDLNYWTDLVRRRWRLALQAGICVFALIALVTILWPPVYESNCKILIQNNRAELLVSPGLEENNPQSPPAVANPVSEQDLNSERELLTSAYMVKLALEGLPVPPKYSASHAFAISVVGALARLPVAGYRAIHDIPRLTPAELWALDVLRHLGASVIKRSDIIEVDFSSRDPRWSKEFLDRLTSKYLDFHARISHDPQAQQFFENQAKLLKDKLTQSENRVRDFELRTGIGNLAGQKQALIDQISGLQTEMAKAAAQLSAAEQEVTTLSSQVSATPEQIEKEQKSVQNLALQQLKPQVMQLQAERAELLSRYQPNSERIKEIDAKLAAAQSILSRENHLEVEEKSVDLNPIWVTLSTDLKGAQDREAALKATRDALAKQVDDAKAQLASLVNNGVELDQLQREAGTDKETFLAYVRKAEEARAADALNSQKILNVSVAQPPAQPIQPVFPSVWLNLAVGGLLAVVVGIGAAYCAEILDSKIYSAATVMEASGLPVVAILASRT